MFETMNPAIAGASDGSWYWGHHAWGLGMGLHGVFWLLLIGLIVVAIVTLVRSTSRNGSGSGTSAMALLDARYARGEIDRDEYFKRKKDLS